MSSIKIIIKYFIFVVGLFFMGLGISLITKSNLGTSPISSVPYVLSMKFSVTLGQFTFLLSCLFLLVEIILLGKKFPKEQFLQILVGSFFGLFVDLGMAIFSSVNPDFYAGKIIALLFGCIVLALGVYLQVAANVIVNPGEGVVKIIANKMGKEFGIIKIMLDCTLVFIAIIISLFAFGTIRGLREGTIISAILVGYITKIFNNIFKHFDFEKKILTILSKPN
jgi:uncharacterized membrane protein YczE